MEWVEIDIEEEERAHLDSSKVGRTINILQGI
jgi:hypothetical protein